MLILMLVLRKGLIDPMLFDLLFTRISECQCASCVKIEIFYNRSINITILTGIISFSINT